MTGELINVRITKRRMTASPSAEGWQPSAARVSATQHRGTNLSRRAIPIIVGTALVAMSLAATPGHAFPPGGTFGAPGPPPLTTTPLQSLASALARSSSRVPMRWGRDPTRSRSQRPSEPRPLDVSPASQLSRSHPSSRTRVAAGSRHNAVSRRSMHACGSASTTPSTPLTRPRSGPLSVNASEAPACTRRLEAAARRLELELHVPDCTGGG